MTGSYRTSALRAASRCRKPGITEARTAERGASLWKSCFTETVDKQSSPPLTGADRPFRNTKIRFNLKESGDRLLGFCISPQMRQGCRKATIGRRESWV